MVSALSAPPVPDYVVGTGEANMSASGTSLQIQVELGGMNPGTMYSLLLIVNGSGRALGNFTTSQDGAASIQTEYSLTPGRYAAGLEVMDVSTLRAAFIAMISEPSSLPLAVEGQYGSSTTAQAKQAVTARVISGGAQQSADIEKAVEDKNVPAVINVGSEGIAYKVLDSNFTLFVGGLQSGGIQITISAQNVNEPRTLLVNLNSSQYLNLQSGSFTVSFDGAAVQEAPSLAEVLTSTASSPPLFVLVSSGSGFELLISIPHFSTHVIQILPAIAGALLAVWALDGPVLVSSLVIVTLAFAAIYSRRQKMLI